MATEKTPKAQPRSVPGLYITAPADRRVYAAGQAWAGASHVPAAQFTAAQLVELRAHKELQVEERELVLEEPAA